MKLTICFLFLFNIICNFIIPTHTYAAGRTSPGTLARARIWSGTCGANCEYEQAAVENELAVAPIVSIKDVEGGNVYPKKVTLSTGTRAMMKIEAFYFPVQKSEVLAYRIDKLFGLELTPVTVLRKVNEKLVSLQLFIEGAETAADRGLTRSETPQSILAFDYLTKNYDRHSYNWIYFPGSSKPIAVDNDNGFVCSGPCAKPMVMLTKRQYLKFCSVTATQIRRTVRSIFSWWKEDSPRIYNGIDKSRRELIRNFEMKTKISQTCLLDQLQKPAAFLFF